MVEPVRQAPSEALQAEWAISVAGVVNAVQRYTDRLKAEAIATERQRLADLRAQAAAQQQRQLEEKRRQAQEHEEAEKAAAEQAADELERAQQEARDQHAVAQQLAADAEAARQQLAADAEVAQQQLAADAEAARVAEAERQAAEGAAAEQLHAAEALRDAQAAAEQAQAAAQAPVLQIADAAHTPVQMSPMEGVPEARMSAWAGGKMRAVLLPTPTCMEGIPEMHGSAWRQRLSEASSDEGANVADEPSVASVGATPPMLSTVAAAAAVEVAGAAVHPDLLKWPSMRATSIVGQPARTPAAPPTLDSVVVPQHPILLPSPPQAAGPEAAPAEAARAAAPAALGAAASPAGSISLDGAVTADGAGAGAVAAAAADSPRSPAWFAQPTGRTPAGHVNAACSAHFPLSDDEDMATDEEHASPPQHELRSAKRSRAELEQQKENMRDASMENMRDASMAQPAPSGGFHEVDFGADGDDYYGYGKCICHDACSSSLIHMVCLDCSTSYGNESPRALSCPLVCVTADANVGSAGTTTTSRARPAAAPAARPKRRQTTRCPCRASAMAAASTRQTSSRPCAT